MADFYVRWGEDVDPYVMRLASEHIDRLRERCAKIAQKIVNSRRRKRRVAAITNRVNLAMLNGMAHCGFRDLGFHFVLKESSNQRPGARKREFILNFATKPQFAPEDMPLRLRKRNGKASARPAKVKRRKRQQAAERVLFNLHNKCAGAGALLSRLPYRLYEMPVTQRIHELSERAVTMWRRRPQMRLGLVVLDTLLRNLREVSAYAPARVWLERRAYGEAIGLPMLLSTLVRADPPIDWDSFPFGEPPEESERLPA